MSSLHLYGLTFVRLSDPTPTESNYHWIQDGLVELYSQTPNPVIGQRIGVTGSQLEIVVEMKNLIDAYRLLDLSPGGMLNTMTTEEGNSIQVLFNQEDVDTLNYYDQVWVTEMDALDDTRVDQICALLARQPIAIYNINESTHQLEMGDGQDLLGLLI